MKANRWANPHPYPIYIPDNLPGPYTLPEHSYKTRAAGPWCYPGSQYNPRVRIPNRIHPYIPDCNKTPPGNPTRDSNQGHIHYFQGPDNPTVRINLININLKRAYRVIHNFIYLIIILHYKYRYNILYMQINIPGLMKAQGHNPKGH